MIYDKTKQLDEIDTYEELLMLIARIMQIRVVRERIQTNSENQPTAPVSMTYDTDIDNITRCYIFAAIPINTNLNASSLPEWKKAMEITQMAPPASFVKP